MDLEQLDSDFLSYLVERRLLPGERLPALAQISVELGLSVGKLREQLEVARSMGLVSVRPRTGIQREPYDFSQAILRSVIFALGTGEASFSQFSQLRRVLECSFWMEATTCLTPQDKEALQGVVVRAWEKLRGEPVHVPRQEHRQLHLLIFRRLDNPFVQGVLTAYWDAYEASELTRFVDYQYWLDVWDYHERIVEALCDNQFEQGRQLLVAHFALLPEVA